MTTTPTAARIYLADQRGLLETAWQQRLSTFNFGEYRAEGREPFGRLLAFNEESLAGGQAGALPVPQATHLLLLPITGAVDFAGPAGLQGSADVGQVQVLTLPAGSTLTWRNPYPDAVITFLHVWLRADSPAAAGSESFAYQFADLDNQLATLVPLGGARPFGLHLGCLQGRHEVVHHVAAPGHELFAFVLAGAFELEGCLLHPHDGLALRHCPAAELEALSNNALLLLLELRGE